jgi:hypothetical protein
VNYTLRHSVQGGGRTIVEKQDQDDEDEYFEHASLGDASVRFAPNLGCISPQKMRVKIFTRKTQIRSSLFTHRPATHQL